jgi:hypothetical protein
MPWKMIEAVRQEFESGSSTGSLAIQNVTNEKTSLDIPVNG